MPRQQRSSPPVPSSIVGPLSHRSGLRPVRARREAQRGREHQRAWGSQKGRRGIHRTRDWAGGRQANTGACWTSGQTGQLKKGSPDEPDLLSLMAYSECLHATFSRKAVMFPRQEGTRTESSIASAPR